MTLVSIIIPCYNEETTIGLLLQALHAQTWPLAELEVIIADGMSTDSTRQQISAFQTKHPRLSIQIADNHSKTIPSGLNKAIAAASGEFIVRLDAHSAPRPDYVERCVAALEQGLGDNVGGVWEIKPGKPTWIAAAIAAAAAHPLGVGDAHYRFTTKAQLVDTVPFGAFRRGLIDRIGGFDESLLANEDYEFNTRVRQSGGTVWLDPAIRSTYFARATLPSLAKQYARYGFWKVRMLRRYPETIRLRQAIPPVFVLSLLTLAVLAVWLPLVGWLLGLEVVLYGLALMAVGIQTAVNRRSFSLLFGVPLAIITMHFFWGGAFLWSIVQFKAKTTVR